MIFIILLIFKIPPRKFSKFSNINLKMQNVNLTPKAKIKKIQTIF